MRGDAEPKCGLIHAAVARCQSCPLVVSHRDVLYVIGFGVSEDLGEPKSTQVDLRLMDGGERERQKVAEGGSGFIVKERAVVHVPAQHRGRFGKEQRRREEVFAPAEGVHDELMDCLGAPLREEPVQDNAGVKAVRHLVFFAVEVQHIDGVNAHVAAQPGADSVPVGADPCDQRQQICRQCVCLLHRCHGLLDV